MLGEIELALSKLPKWMKDEGRMGDASLFFKPMSRFLHHHDEVAKRQDRRSGDSRRESLW
jgi:hypothetical protein